MDVGPEKRPFFRTNDDPRYQWQRLTVVHTLIAMDIDFEWDEHKRQVNLRKHGVDFADAVEVFYDDLACVMEDPDHHDEQRFVVIGIDAFQRVLVVVYTQPDEQTIRIISARAATAAERRHYQQG